jgi:hypothetical protein
LFRAVGLGGRCSANLMPIETAPAGSMGARSAGTPVLYAQLTPEPDACGTVRLGQGTQLPWSRFVRSPLQAWR